ncbi:pik3r4 kinase-related protein (incomplete catalytic triad) [Cystoisospora suis]|uniref:non-specific serine/threonine protein kinase n=1 Tax=Cystoisospora suis TaxID=483139 RepID=A0A2C6LFH8_9APIC|nr:pik3r4 kinase-related protein (incomplete catalytic triad) [Cystoisospora suis]
MGNVVATGGSTSTGGTPPPALPVYTPNVFHSAVTTGFFSGQQASDSSSSASLAQNAAAGGSASASGGSSSSGAGAGAGTALADEVATFMSDFPSVNFLRCIGSSRLFRTVAVVTAEEGLCVGKLLVRKEPQSTVASYVQQYALQLQAYKAHLLPDLHPNVCTYGRLLASERSAILLRQFFPFCLSDRLHARPFLSSSQQLFLAFQVILGVTQFHSLGLAHGDIKTENVGITSWLHGCLIDAAPWKPLRLSLSDGRELTAFFNSPFSGKCQIAPERFCCEPDELNFSKEEDRGSSGAPDSSVIVRPVLPGSRETTDVTESFDLSSLEALQSADVFSMACTLSEVFGSDAPGKQHTVIDLPILLQLRRLLRSRSRRQGVYTRRKGGRRKTDAAAGSVQNTPSPSSLANESSARPENVERPRLRCCEGGSGNRSPSSAAFRNIPKHDEENGSGDRRVAERETKTTYPCDSASSFPTPTPSKFSPHDIDKAGKEFAGKQQGRVDDNGAVSSSMCSLNYRGGEALPCFDSSSFSSIDVGVPRLRALSHALRAIRSRRIRETLQKHVFLRYPEMRLTAFECLERWAGSRRDEAFFPACFLSYFLPFFTVLTHPAYQQPDLRILLIRQWLPHMTAAVLQTRRNGFSEQKENVAKGEERKTDTLASSSTGGVYYGVVNEEWNREELEVVQVLEEAVEHHVLSVDPQIMYQSILHGALTSPDCAPVAALISAWGTARRQDASRGIVAVSQHQKASRRQRSDVPDVRLPSSPPPVSPHSGGFPSSSERKVSSRTSPRHFSRDVHREDWVDSTGTALSSAGTGVSDGSSRDFSGTQMKDAAAAGAAEAVGGFGSVPHPDLSLPSARRFSSRLLAVWRKSRRRIVKEKRPVAEVLRALERERCAVYNELFLSPVRARTPLADRIGITHAHSFSDRPRISSCARVEPEGLPQGQKDVRSSGGVPVCAGASPFSALSGGRSSCTQSHCSGGPLYEACKASSYSHSDGCTKKKGPLWSFSASDLSYPSSASLSASLNRPCFPVTMGPLSCPRRGSCILIGELIGSTLQQCSSPQVRCCGVSMLAFLSRFSTLHTLLKCIFPYLVKALDDPIPAVRVAALRVFPTALCQVYASRPTGWRNSEESTEESSILKDVRDKEESLSGISYGQERTSQEANRMKQVQEERRETARCTEASFLPERSCCYPYDVDEEEEADLVDDLSAMRSLARGFFDFSLFFIQTLLPRLHQLASTEGEPSVQLTVAEQLPMFLLSIQHCAEVQASIQAVAAASSGMESTSSPVRGSAPQQAGEESRFIVGTKLYTANDNLLGKGGIYNCCKGLTAGCRASSSLVLVSDSRVQQLRSAVKPLLQHLLTSRQPAERLALLQRVDALAEFLGPEVSQQFLLPYLIMQLNDPLVPSIRAAVTLALGRMSLLLGGARGIVETCVLPCCEQALVDIREEVLLAALQTLQLLASAGLLVPCWNGILHEARTGGEGQRGKLRGGDTCSGEILNLLRSRVLPLLMHPCEAVRLEALRMLQVLQTQWGRVDIFVFLVPLFKPFAVTREGVDCGVRTVECFLREYSGGLDGRVGKQISGDGGRDQRTRGKWKEHREGENMGEDSHKMRTCGLGLLRGDEQEKRYHSSPTLYGVEELWRYLTRPLSHAVYLHLMKPEYGQTLAALSAAIIAAEEGRPDEDVLARILFKVHDGMDSRGCSLDRRSSSSGKNHDERHSVAVVEKEPLFTPSSPVKEGREKRAGRPNDESSSHSPRCSIGMQTKGLSQTEVKQKDSRRERLWSSVGTSETETDEDDEDVDDKLDVIDTMEGNLAIFMVNRRLAHQAKEEETGQETLQHHSASCVAESQQPKALDRRHGETSWNERVSAFLTFFSSVDPSSVSRLSWEQRRCIGLLLGLRPSDRRALILLLPYLCRVAMDRSQNTLSTLALFTPPLLGCSADSQRRHTFSASSLHAAVAAATDQLDEVLPAGELLGVGWGEEDGLRKDLQEDDETFFVPIESHRACLKCTCLQPPQIETSAREYILRCCLLSPPLPAAIHSLPSLRLSPLQALLPLLPASLLSSSSCEVPSLLTVCMLLTLSSQQETLAHSIFLLQDFKRKSVSTGTDLRDGTTDIRRGESGRKSVRTDSSIPPVNGSESMQERTDWLDHGSGSGWRRDGSLPPTRTDFLTQLQIATSAATGAAELLAVAASATAGSRFPLPSLQQAMLGRPQVGSELAMLLNQDPSRLSGLLPFELFPAAVKGAVAGSTALQSPPMASGTIAPPHSIVAAARCASPRKNTSSGFVRQRSVSPVRSFCLPSPLQRDWRCVVLGLPRRPSLEVGRLSKWASVEGTSTLNLYSYVTASPPVVLQHPLLLHPAFARGYEGRADSPTRGTGGQILSRSRSRTDSASTLGTSSPRGSSFKYSEDREIVRTPLLPGSQFVSRDSINAASDVNTSGAKGGEGVFAEMSACSSSLSQPQRETATGPLLTKSADSSRVSCRNEARTSFISNTASASSSVIASPRPCTDVCSDSVQTHISSRTEGVSQGGGTARTAPSQSPGASPGETGANTFLFRKESDVSRAHRTGEGGSLHAAGKGHQNRKYRGRGGVAIGCGVVLSAVPGVADMASWRPRGELVGTLWEMDVTGGQGEKLTTGGGGLMRSGRRVQLASSEDGRILITACTHTVDGPINAWSCTEVVRQGRASPFSSWTLPKPLAATALRFLHNTRTVGVGASDGSCRLFRLDEGRRSSSRMIKGRVSRSSSRGGGDSCDLLLTLSPPAFPLISPSDSLPSNSLCLPRGSGDSRYFLGRYLMLLGQRRALRSLLPSSLSGPSPVFSSACSPSLSSDPPSSLFVEHVVKATGAMTTASRAVVSIDHFDSCFEQLLLYLLQSGQAGAFDLRASSTPIFSSALLPPWWGTPTAQCVSPDGKCLCLGTAGGFLLLFDLRLLLPVRAWRVRHQVLAYRAQPRREDEEQRDVGGCHQVAPVILQLRPCPLRLLLLQNRHHSDPSMFPMRCSSSTRGNTDKYVSPQVAGDPPSTVAGESHTTTDTLSRPGGDGVVGFSSAPTNSEKGSETGGGLRWEPRRDRQIPGRDSFDSTHRNRLSSGAEMTSTEGSLVIALIGGGAGVVAILDLEFGHVLATFSSSCYSAGLTNNCGNGDVPTEQKDGNHGTRQTDNKHFETYDVATGHGYYGLASRLWLEPVDRASLLSSSPSFSSADQVIAGLSVTAHSPHAPRCLFVPPFLRAPPSFFLVGGNDRCVRFWSLKNSSGFLKGEEDGIADYNEAQQKSQREADMSSLENAIPTHRYITSHTTGRCTQGVDAYVVLAPEDGCCAEGNPCRREIAFESWGSGSTSEGAGGGVVFGDRVPYTAQNPLVYYQAIQEEVVSGVGDLLSRTVHFQEVCRLHRHRSFEQRILRKTKRKNNEEEEEDAYNRKRAQSSRGGELTGERELARESEHLGTVFCSREDELGGSRDSPLLARAGGGPAGVRRDGHHSVSSRGSSVSSLESLSEDDECRERKRPGFWCPSVDLKRRPCCCGTRDDWLQRAHGVARLGRTDSRDPSFRQKSEDHWWGGRREEKDELLLRDAGPRPPSVQHRDAILDLSFLELNHQLLLVTSGRDGVVRIWR